MKIGITERGDAACSLIWVEECRKRNVDGAVIITKRLTDAVKSNLLDLYKDGFPLMLHATITGWGGTYLEPGVWDYKQSVDSLKGLIDAGFPASHVVIRIDPMFPTLSGVRKVKEVMAYMQEKGLFSKGNGIRLRMSIYDEYPHVRQRLADLGLKPMYGGSFYAPKQMMNYLAQNLKSIREELNALPDTFVPVFATCAEDDIVKKFPDDFVVQGCISETDLKLMELACPENVFENIQHRKGCHCLSVKTELLTKRKPCPHNCIYCYWKN